MIKQTKTPICAADGCNNEFIKFRSTDKYCSLRCKLSSTPKKKKKHYVIPKKSAKKAAADIEYYKIRAEFLNNLKSKICPVFPAKLVTDIHHKKGRIGFADEWAKENNIPLLIDTRFFLAVSRKGHEQIENNPIWAKENGFSLDRLTNINHIKNI